MTEEQARPWPWAALAVAMALFSAPKLASADDNFAPIANGTVGSQEALVGESLTFSSAGSVDPDTGPHPLSFHWDLGDGTYSTDPNPVHTYSARGLYGVTLTVSDGEAQGLATLDVVVLDPPAEAQPSKASPIAIRSDDAVLVVANPDSNSISFVDVGFDGAVQEVDVGLDPRTVAYGMSERYVYVACYGDNQLWVVDADTRSVSKQLQIGHQPWGVAVVPSDGRVIVTHEGDATVHIFDASMQSQAMILDVPDTPRAIAVTGDGTRAFVTHFLTRGEVGQVTTIDLTTNKLVGQTALVEDQGPDTSSSGRGFPNLLGAAAIHPDGKVLFVGGLKANTARGMYLSGEQLVPRNRLRGLLAQVDPASGDEIVDRRIDTNDADSVTAMAFSPRGRYAYLVHQGAARVSVYDLPVAAVIEPGDGSTPTVDARVDVGDAPQGILISNDGRRIYVTNLLSRDVTVFDSTDLTNPVVIDTISVTDEPLSPEVANGKRMFYASREPIHSDQNYIACFSCHPDGGMDGRTWDFTHAGEGLRNTIDLRGRAGVGHGPVHWSANFDEIQDFENDIVHGFGGEGLAQDGFTPHPPLAPQKNAGRSSDLDDLAAYVTSLARPPPSPYREPGGSLSPAAIRGYEIFFDDTVGCAGCHTPPNFTDSRLTKDSADFVLHDVGTLTEASGGRLGGDLPGLDTPTVLGVWATSPYLHDGRAKTLREVVTIYNPNDRHGVTSQLSSHEIDDLVTYLLSLEGAEDEHPGVAPMDGPHGSRDSHGCTTQNRNEVSRWWTIGFGIMFLLSRRRLCASRRRAWSNTRCDPNRVVRVRCLPHAKHP